MRLSLALRSALPSWPATLDFPVTEDLSDIAALLEQDVARTLGPGHRHMIAAVRAKAEGLDITDGARKLVEDVQQLFHDTFVHTTWPACPRHRTHPLWYADGAWWCAQDRAMVAPLGELSTSRGAFG